MNVLRYLKRNICAKKHTFFYKTPAGFRDEILPLLEAKVKKISGEKPEDSPAIARCQRGVEVHGLNLKDATLVALTLPLFQDFFLIFSRIWGAGRALESFLRARYPF